MIRVGKSSHLWCFVLILKIDRRSADWNTETLGVLIIDSMSLRLSFCSGAVTAT